MLQQCLPLALLRITATEAREKVWIADGVARDVVGGALRLPLLSCPVLVEMQLECVDVAEVEVASAVGVKEVRVAQLRGQRVEDKRAGPCRARAGGGGAGGRGGGPGRAPRSSASAPPDLPSRRGARASFFS